MMISRLRLLALATVVAGAGACTSALPGNVVALASPVQIPDNQMLAFPGAMGWAAQTPGGRGGQIVRVTTLAAEGPGSLREALET